MSAHDTLQFFDIDSPLSTKSNRHSNHLILRKKTHNRSMFPLSLRILFFLDSLYEAYTSFLNIALHRLSQKGVLDALSISRLQFWA